MYKLYVIPGSHACRAAILMLDHKGVEYRTIEFITLTHPVMARLHGFDAGGQSRNAGGRRTFGLRFGDRLATVPGLAIGRERISTNHAIARFLDERHPGPPLFPAEPELREAVEEAERWANETLQMAARRVLGGGLAYDGRVMAEATGDGRLGVLLYRNPSVRRVVIPWVLRSIFAAGPHRDAEVVGELPAMLDRVDRWIGDGVLGGERLNAADFMVAPSLALMLYRPDVQHLFEGRPALGLVDRLLPEPARA